MTDEWQGQIAPAIRISVGYPLEISVLVLLILVLVVLALLILILVVLVLLILVLILLPVLVLVFLIGHNVTLHKHTARGHKIRIRLPR